MGHRQDLGLQVLVVMLLAVGMFSLVRQEPGVVAETLVGQVALAEAALLERTAAAAQGEDRGRSQAGPEAKGVMAMPCWTRKATRRGCDMQPYVLTTNYRIFHDGCYARVNNRVLWYNVSAGGAVTGYNTFVEAGCDAGYTP